jgi:hypothetical protein
VGGGPDEKELKVASTFATRSKPLYFGFFALPRELRDMVYYHFWTYWERVMECTVEGNYDMVAHYFGSDSKDIDRE